MNTAIAYTMDSLFYVLLKAKGVPVKDHAVKAELQRVGQYMKRIKEAEEGPEQPTLRVDSSAAKRLVRGGLAGNDRLAEQPAPFGGLKKRSAEGDETEKGKQGTERKKRREEMKSPIHEKPTKASSGSGQKKAEKKERRKHKKKASDFM
uniref:Nuclear nucleic acid-binding protein C1D n=1 Tax=Octactis speculum TaxID=3111310 RepID=A0A7S2DQ08_9STRA